jgi:hypothetical protein
MVWSAQSFCVMPAMETNPECDVDFSQIILTAVFCSEFFTSTSVDDLNGNCQRVMEKYLNTV